MLSKRSIIPSLLCSISCEKEEGFFVLVEILSWISSCEKSNHTRNLSALMEALS